MAMSLVTVATLRQTTLHVRAGIVVCGIIACNMARVKNVVFSDVNCGMLFCASNGQYQWTASADIVLVTVYPAHGVECL